MSTEDTPPREVVDAPPPVTPGDAADVAPLTARGEAGDVAPLIARGEVVDVAPLTVRGEVADASVQVQGDGSAMSGAAFAEWVRPSMPAMTRLARRLAPRAEPDDVVQDALLRAWQKYDTYDAALGTPTTWLLAIVADKARAARTARVRRLGLVDDTHEVPDPATEDAAADIDLDRAIRRLPERQGLAVHLHYFLGLSVAETAQVMACSAGTVKSTLFDARTALRRALGDPDD